MRIGLQKVSFGRILALGVAALTVASLAPQSGASAATLVTLHSFCSVTALAGTPPAPTCKDGVWPVGGLVMDPSGNGNLYGTTSAGGNSAGGGVVFQLTPANKSFGLWSETVLYNFCTQGGTKCSDGQTPLAGLLIDQMGNLYGTTQAGGAGGGGGTVFELIPNATKTGWTETVLYSFCASTNCRDGANPQGALLMDQMENLYGTTQAGGSPGSSGTVFALSNNAANTPWSWTAIYNFAFCAPAASNCTDGFSPLAGLISDPAGHIYGTAALGGANKGVRYAAGTVFELPVAGAETILYSFCAQRESGASCTDGAEPWGGLSIDAAGNLYGTTAYGGANGSGTVFELIPNVGTTGWTERVLYSFCKQSNCADGANPVAGLFLDTKSGNLYGTTKNGGNSFGTLFELSPPNATTPTWTQTVLYTFCPHAAPCTDGANPEAGLIMDPKSGYFYGTTYNGGAYDGGTAFELRP
jgi:uncharacterized repeat protein (TIGR03803 family)